MRREGGRGIAIAQAQSLIRGESLERVAAAAPAPPRPQGTRAAVTSRHRSARPTEYVAGVRTAIDLAYAKHQPGAELCAEVALASAWMAGVSLAELPTLAQDEPRERRTGECGLPQPPTQAVVRRRAGADSRCSSGASVRAVSAETTGSARNTGPRVDVRPGPIAGDIRLGEGHAAHCAKPAATSSVWLLWAVEVVVGDHAVLDRGLSVQVAVRDEAAPGAFVPRDRWRIKVGSSSRNLSVARG